MSPHWAFHKSPQSPGEVVVVITTIITIIPFYTGEARLREEGEVP